MAIGTRLCGTGPRRASDSLQRDSFSSISFDTCDLGSKQKTFYET
jgi:hypothetical protein